MNIESFNPVNNTPKVEPQPTENSDYNYFLEITNRRINYKRATTESKEELIKNLETILTSLKEEQNERMSDNYDSEAKQRYYQEVPKIEIKVLKELLDFYK